MSDSWLFEKGDSSVRIVRTGTLVFDVFGPGEHCDRHSFANDNQLMTFLRSTAEELIASGYQPRGYAADRRTADRPSDVERRRQSTVAV